MDYPGRQTTRKAVFWFCHQCSLLQYIVLSQTIDDEDGRYVDAMVAWTENTMMGSSVLPSSLLLLLDNFIWTMLLKTSSKEGHMRVMEK